MTTPLRVEVGEIPVGGPTFRFHAVAGQAYALQATELVSPTDLQTLKPIPAPATTADLTVNDETATGATRFYRVITMTEP